MSIIDLNRIQKFSTMFIKMNDNSFVIVLVVVLIKNEKQQLQTIMTNRIDVLFLFFCKDVFWNKNKKSNENDLTSIFIFQSSQ